MSTAALIGSIVVLALTVPFWWPASASLHRVCAVLASAVLAVVWLLPYLASLDPDVAPPETGAVVLLLGLTAVVGGGPVCSAILSTLVRPQERPGEVLRGGAWIGALERAAVFVALLVGQPAAVAVVVAVKGLGRYPEIKADEGSGAGRGGGRGAAERFIAGTLASLLWAGICALVAKGIVQDPGALVRGLGR